MQKAEEELDWTWRLEGGRLSIVRPARTFWKAKGGRGGGWMKWRAGGQEVVASYFCRLIDATCISWLCQPRYRGKNSHFQNEKVLNEILTFIPMVAFDVDKWAKDKT